MPELPEVEVVRRELESLLAGAAIIRIVCGDRRIARGPLDSVVGRIRSVERRGKWIRLAVGEHRVFLHLGMTGDWAFRKPGEPTLRFERARIETKEISARYVDMRRWGKMIASTDDIPQWTELGPDPLHDGIDPEVLRARIGKRGSIKVALMDQTVLAGIGNILAVEALWRAKIDPRARAHRLSPKRFRALVRSLERVIDRMLAYDLQSMEDGDARSPFRIYGKKACPRCKDDLRRIELGGRTTTFCRTCQKRS